MKYKLTFALVASLTSTAFAEFKAPLPEFKNEKQLAEWRAEKASEATSQGYAVEETAFYTGRSYLAASAEYAFKYRNYSPELARWTSEDPSGFPDGANGNFYAPVPTTELDYQGLLVTATYSITKKKLTIENTSYLDLNSGDNIYGNRFEQGGPIPTGVYEIFSRQQGAASYGGGGHQAFILDPIDGNRYNDLWNGGAAANRNSFRIHTSGDTEGCIAVGEIDMVAAQIWGGLGSSTVRRDIVQAAPTPNPETFSQEWLLGTLTVVE